MELFYCPDIQGNLFTLEAEESFHLIRTTRHRQGEEVWVTNGMGEACKVRIEVADSRKSVLQVVDRQSFPRPEFQIRLAVSPTKNDSRFEWLVEKAVELGIQELIPIQTKRSEKVWLKQERLQKIMLAAAKQSLCFHFPKISAVTEFSDLLNSTKSESILLAHCLENRVRTPLLRANLENRVLLFIGPEGDFTESEIDLAESLGAQSVHLGNTRLRTETAAISALSALHLQHAAR